MNILETPSVPSLLCDFYKTSHVHMYPEGLQRLYSTLTPRSTKHAPHIERIVVFGIQSFIIRYLGGYFENNFFKAPWSKVLKDYEDTLKRSGMAHRASKYGHLKALHDLGYLPLEIKAIDEGKTVAPGVPVMTICNTHENFAWLTNYFETLINCSVWQPMTSASIARVYRQTLERYAAETCDDNNHVLYQAHDFSMRGMSSLETAEMSGAGHLLYFLGTDTIPAINYLAEYYTEQDDKAPKLIGTSIPATEHSIMSAHGTDDLPTFKRLMKLYWDSPLSIVADTLDFWRNITETLPALKDDIMNRRDGCPIIIRPDSGDPALILCGNPNANTTHERKGLIECLWDIFGGSENSKGYKVLDPHIGAVYGDSITFERMNHILERLRDKGFASSNIVFGVGSFTYQYNTRDTLGFATKATLATIHGVERAIYKDPKTDDGTKRSHRGAVAVIRNGGVTNSGLTLAQSRDRWRVPNELQTVYRDGKLIRRTSLSDIRANTTLGLYD